MMHITLIAMITGILMVYFWPLVVVTIPAGYRGVRWYRFDNGTDLARSLTEGTRLKFPWDQVYRYDARLRVVTRSFNAITKDGLSVTTTISFRYRINPEYVGVLHQSIGPDYVSVLLIPEIGSSARVLIALYTAEDFYTTYRLQVQSRILTQIRNRLLDGSIYSRASVALVELDDVMINEIVLPKSVQSAIAKKVEAYQQTLEYDFLLTSEKKEAERKEIEGRGVRAMFDIVGHEDLDSYLRLSGINATLALANSPNAKFVIAGSGVNGGLPVLLGGDLGTSGTALGKSGVSDNKSADSKSESKAVASPIVPASSVSAKHSAAVPDEAASSVRK